MLTESDFIAGADDNVVGDIDDEIWQSWLIIASDEEYLMNIK